MNSERRPRDLTLIGVILLLGMCLMVAAGQAAIRLHPSWQVKANMGSKMDPDRLILTLPSTLQFEPLRPEILTPPAWAGTFLTPLAEGEGRPTIIPIFTFGPTVTQPTARGISPTSPLPTLTPSPSQVAGPTWTLSPTPTPTPSATRTVVYYPTFTSTPSQIPAPTHTRTPTSSQTPSPTSTSTLTASPSSTPTPSFTPSPSNTPTSTPTPLYPNINFGPPDGAFSTIPDGNSATFYLATPIRGHGDDGWDLVYYERAAGSGILMDMVIIQISEDGSNWHTVFYWGNGIADTNSNLNINIIGGSEDDNRDIASSWLINGTGVGIDIDALGLSGTYPYLRITSPSGGAGDGCDVDAIQIY